jgi:hypothetical protein
MTPSYRKLNEHSNLFKYINKYQGNQSSICSTVAKHLTHKPKIKGLNPDKKGYLQCTECCHKNIYKSDSGYTCLGILRQCTTSIIISQNSWNFAKFSWYNTLLLFSCDVLCWLFLFLSVLSKVDHIISVSFGLIQNFEVSNLAMAKVKKVNITDT